MPEINLVFLEIDLRNAATPPSLTFGDDTALSEGDFVIALGNPQGPQDGLSLGMLIGRSSSSWER